MNFTWFFLLFLLWLLETLKLPMRMAFVGSQYILIGRCCSRHLLVILETVALRGMTTGGGDGSGYVQACFISFP